MRDPFVQKQIFRTEQKAKLLIARPDFQQEILNLRQKFDVPPCGLMDQKKNEEWHHNFYQSDDVYFETVWKKKSLEIGKLRKAKKFKEAEALKKKLNNAAPINSFRIAIKNILKKYKLLMNWEESVWKYLLFNDLDGMWLPAGITIHTKVDEDTGLQRFFVEIEDSITLRGIGKKWSIIKYFQKQLNSYTRQKFQPIKKLKRYQKAYELKQKGKSLNEIALILSKDEDKIYIWSDAAKFVDRYKKHLGIN